MEAGSVNQLSPGSRRSEKVAHHFMDDTALSHTIHNGLRIIIPIFSLLISSPKSFIKCFCICVAGMATASRACEWALF